jgi:signal peptidase I
LSPVPQIRRHHEAQDGLLTMLKSVAEIIIVAMFLVTFVVQPFRIPSGSMEPTLKVGDFLLVDKQSYGPSGGLDRLVLPPARVRRGDLVVFHYPVDARLHLVKRVVGLPGDRIRMRGGRVLVNGRMLREPYAFYSASRPNGFRDEFPSMLTADPDVDLRWWIELRRSIYNEDVIVPPNEYFVLGDNRNDSEDSRYWGFVPRSAMVGRPLLVYFTLPLAEEFHGVSVLGRLRDALRVGVRSWRVLR